MAIDLVPLPLPASADASKFGNFGREVKGLHPGKLTPEQLNEVQEALYKVDHNIVIHSDSCPHLTTPQYDALLFRNVIVTPEEQYALTKVKKPLSHLRFFRRPDCRDSHLIPNPNHTDTGTTRPNLPRNPSFTLT
jgi:hypothetical protein